MATITNTIEITDDLMSAAEKYASLTHQSVGELAQKALQVYIDHDPYMEAMRQHHCKQAAALGLTLEEYVERLVHEYRAERRSAAA